MIGRFNALGTYYAQMMDGSTLHIWNVNSGKREHAVHVKEGLKDAVIDLVWTDNNAQDLDTTIVLATEGGRHIFVNAAHGTCKVAPKATTHKKGVAALACDGANNVFSIDTASQLIVFDAETKAAEVDTKCPIRSVRTLVHRSKDDILFCVGANARAYNTGESSWSPAFDAHCGTAVASAVTTSHLAVVSNERLLTVFYVPQGAFNEPRTFGHLAATAPLAAVPMSVSATAQSDKSTLIAVVLEGGTIQHFELVTRTADDAAETNSNAGSAKKRRRGRRTSKRRGTDTPTNDQPSVPESDLVEVKYPLAQNIEQVFLLENTRASNGQTFVAAISAEGTLRFHHTAYGTPKNFKLPGEAHFNTVNHIAENGDAFNIGSTAAAVASAHPDPARAFTQSLKRHRITADASLGERVRELSNHLNSKTKEDLAADDAEDSAITASMRTSMVTVLQQALQGDDDAMLERCILSANSDANINTTVSQLDTKYVLPFVSKLVNKFEARPARGPLLLTWLRSVLIQHTAHLMTMPKLLSRLLGLYQTINARLSVFRKLLRLQGRLDLLLSHAQAPPSSGAVVDKAPVFDV